MTVESLDSLHRDKALMILQWFVKSPALFYISRLHEIISEKIGKGLLQSHYMFLNAVLVIFSLHSSKRKFI